MNVTQSPPTKLKEISTSIEPPRAHRQSSSTSFGPITPKHATTSTSQLSQKELLLKLRELAQEPQQQPYLISNEKCLSALRDVLDIKNLELCILSLQTLQFLSLNPKYRQTLATVPQLLDKIDFLSKHTITDTTTNPDSNTNTNSNSNSNSKSSSSLKSVSSHQTTMHLKINQIALSLIATITKKIDPSTQKSQQQQQTYKPRPLQTIQMKIVNLDDDKAKDEIQQIGIKINGVISVTVNMQTKDVTFYCTRDNMKKLLVNNLRSSGFQIVFNDGQQAVDKSMDTMSIHSGVSNFTDKNRAKLSSLQYNAASAQANNNDIDSSNSNSNPNSNSNSHFASSAVISGAQYIQPNSLLSNKTGITRYGQQSNALSLSQRLAMEKVQQDEEEQKQIENQSMLSKVFSYIW